MTTFGPSASKQAEGFYDADKLFPLHAGADGSVVGSVDMNISCAPFVANPTAPNVLPQQYKGERLHRQAKTASGVAMARGPADDDGSNGDKSAPVILILLWSMCAVVLLASATVVRRSNRRQHSTSVKLEGLSGGRTAVKHPLGYGAWVDIQRTGALERAARATTSALPKAAATDVSLTESENSIKSDLSTFRPARPRKIWGGLRSGLSSSHFPAGCRLTTSRRGPPRRPTRMTKSSSGMKHLMCSSTPRATEASVWKVAQRRPSPHMPFTDFCRPESTKKASFFERVSAKKTVQNSTSLARPRHW